MSECVLKGSWLKLVLCLNIHLAQETRVSSLLHFPRRSLCEYTEVPLMCTCITVFPATIWVNFICNVFRLQVCWFHWQCKFLLPSLSSCSTGAVSWFEGGCKIVSLQHVNCVYHKYQKIIIQILMGHSFIGNVGNSVFLP